MPSSSARRSSSLAAGSSFGSRASSWRRREPPAASSRPPRRCLASARRLASGKAATVARRCAGSIPRILAARPSRSPCTGTKESSWLLGGSAPGPSLAAAAAVGAASPQAAPAQASADTSSQKLAPSAHRNSQSSCGLREQQAASTCGAETPVAPEAPSTHSKRVQGPAVPALRASTGLGWALRLLFGASSATISAGGAGAVAFGLLHAELLELLQAEADILSRYSSLGRRASPESLGGRSPVGASSARGVDDSAGGPHRVPGPSAMELNGFARARGY
mmetsp:Transcript_32458/g.65575  ORF Transcript_32458/g.65575 Transcript_32458/m.65575 type:complete len:278 (+) Transcript_32458:241-1074(+)